MSRRKVCALCFRMDRLDLLVDRVWFGYGLANLHWPHITCGFGDHKSGAHICALSPFGEVYLALRAGQCGKVEARLNCPPIEWPVSGAPRVFHTEGRANRSTRRDGQCATQQQQITRTQRASRPKQMGTLAGENPNDQQHTASTLTAIPTKQYPRKLITNAHGRGWQNPRSPKPKPETRFGMFCSVVLGASWLRPPIGQIDTNWCKWWKSNSN